MRHPIQPLALDDRGVLRFKRNAIVEYLLDKGPFDMNHLAVQDFSNEDREQFAQLIGYSLLGFGDLNYASSETCSMAEEMSKNDYMQVDLQIDYLRGTIKQLQNDFREPIARLYDMHPDDLCHS